MGEPKSGELAKKQHVLVVGDERKGGTREVVAEQVAWLESRARVTIVLDRDAPLHTEDVDLVVVLGGDGSILSAVRRMGEEQRPTLGINLGRLGFLTAFAASEARHGIELALAGKLHREDRVLLTCRVERADGSVTPSFLALNDGVLARAASAAIVTVTARRGGKELASYAGDGLIVATPTGSTAYSLAAGGPILTPDLPAVVLTPLASHALGVRPLVVSSNGAIELAVEDAGGADACTFVVDGQVPMDVRPGDRVVLREAGARFRALVRTKNAFFQILHEKLGWADLPRQRAQRKGRSK